MAGRSTTPSGWRSQGRQKERPVPEPLRVGVTFARRACPGGLTHVLGSISRHGSKPFADGLQWSSRRATPRDRRSLLGFVRSTRANGRVATGVTPGRTCRRANHFTGRRPRCNRPRHPSVGRRDGPESARRPRPGRPRRVIGGPLTVSAPGRSRRRPGRAAPPARTPARRGRPGCSRAGRSRTRSRAGRTRTRRDSRPCRRHTRRRSNPRPTWHSRPRPRSSPWSPRSCTPLQVVVVAQARRRWHASDDVAQATISIEAISRLPLKLRVMVSSPLRLGAFTMKRHARGATRRHVSRCASS